MNVYLIVEDDGVTVFDAGVRMMKTQILGGVASKGKLKRVVLGHAHADHRGAARGLAAATGAEVWCHEDERKDAEGDGGLAHMLWISSHSTSISPSNMSYSSSGMAGRSRSHVLSRREIRSPASPCITCPAMPPA